MRATARFPRFDAAASLKLDEVGDSVCDDVAFSAV